MQFLRHIKDVVRFNQLHRSKRSLTFYSEGRNYWPHLEGLLREVLNTSDIPVCYVSSGSDDPGLTYAHPNLQTFKIDTGFVRNWFFENIDTDVMVLTMPDIDQYQVKRSKFKVHYVYIQHSLVSLHMVYRAGAFDHYDTIFCAGPHHKAEIRAIEAHGNLPPKNLVEHGYGRLAAIRQTAVSCSSRQSIVGSMKHFLIAPSWGPEGIVESGTAFNIVEKLVSEGHQVTLRPHPQTVKFARPKVDEIRSAFATHPNFSFEGNVDGQESLLHSDVMISDWSGAALDYAFGLEKPVLFIDVPRKINNPDYESLGIEPFEVYIREEIGQVISTDQLSSIDIRKLQVKAGFEKHFYSNPDQRGGAAVIDILEKVSRDAI